MNDPPPGQRPIDEIDAILQELHPDRTPLTEAAKAAIHQSVGNAPPMTEQQCRRIGRLLRGSRCWST